MELRYDQKRFYSVSTSDLVFLRGTATRCIVLGPASEFVYATCMNPYLVELSYLPDRLAVAKDVGVGWKPDLVHYSHLQTAADAVAHLTRLADAERTHATMSATRAGALMAKADRGRGLSRERR